MAALIDPIGTLIGMGLSWVLEHIWPLNEYLNALTENAGEDGIVIQTSEVAQAFGQPGGATQVLFFRAEGDSLVSLTMQDLIDLEYLL